MSSILYRCIRSLSILFKNDIGSNFSFHSATDFLKKVTNRTQKYPALVIRSTKFEQDLFYRAMAPIVTKDLNTNTFVSKNIPEMYDAYFKCMLFCEGNIEGLETISKLISFFGRYRYLDVSDYDEVNLSTIPVIPANPTPPIYPVITDSTYDVVTGHLTLIGTNFVSIAGSNNDIDSTKFTITGNLGNTKTITNLTSKVEILNNTSAIIHIVDSDKDAFDSLLNKNGLNSLDGTTYNLSANSGWNGNTSILNNCRIVVRGVEMTYTRYNMNLVSTEEDNEDNASDISKYEIIFFIEGVQFSTNEETSGKLASDIIPDVNSK